MGVADLQRRFYRLNAHVFFQCHGAKTYLGNTGAMGFNHLHYNLLGTALERVCGGWRRMPCPHRHANGVPRCPARHQMCGKKSLKFFVGTNRHNTLGHKLFVKVLTLE
jgi:hypothetical protein